VCRLSISLYLACVSITYIWILVKIILEQPRKEKGRGEGREAKGCAKKRVRKSGRAKEQSFVVRKSGVRKSREPCRR
jgi:hypothetical protein